MNWTTLLTAEMEDNYRIAARLIDLVDEDQLNWKPTTGTNWMTVGQLLMHISNACGAACKGFVTGDWGLPEGFDLSSIPPEEMLPPAEKLPSIKSLSQAKELLAEDRLTALEMVKSAGEENLANKITTAPWDNIEMILGRRLLAMVNHLSIHKAQLFYYLKLLGKPVHTGHLWG